MTAELCGNRFGRNFILPGGTRFGLDAARAGKILDWLRRVKRDLDGALKLFFDSPTVLDRLENTGTRIISYDVNSDSLTLRVVAVGRELSENTIKNAEQSMADYKLGRYRLQVIQGSESDSVMLLNNKLANMHTSTDNYAAMFHEEAQKTARLQELLNEYTRYEAMAPVIAKETKALFPKTRNISLALANEASADTTVLKRYAVAIIGIEQQTRLTDDEQKRMSEWLGTRLGVDTVHIFIRH